MLFCTYNILCMYCNYQNCVLIVIPFCVTVSYLNARSYCCLKDASGLWKLLLQEYNKLDCVSTYAYVQSPPPGSVAVCSVMTYSPCMSIYNHTF